MRPDDLQNRFTVQLARSNEELLETQRLRYRVFAEELGARLDDGGTRFDRDGFDIYCRHLYVRDTRTGAVVACTRILTDDRAEDAGGFYSAGEFDIDFLRHLPGRALEIGRTCVDPDYRNGAVIALLWWGIAAFIRTEDYDHLFGCASIPMADGGAGARALVETLRRDHLAPPYRRVRPRRPLPAGLAAAPGATRMPPLLKAYLSLGAYACGEAFYDEDFNCADVFMLLNVAELHPRYARRFFGTERRAAPGVALA